MEKNLENEEISYNLFGRHERTPADTRPVLPLTSQRRPAVLSPALSPAPSSAPELGELRPAYEPAVPPPRPSFWPAAPAAASPPPGMTKRMMRSASINKHARTPED